MNEQKILETLSRFNRWWVGEEIPKIILRSKHDTISKKMDKSVEEAFDELFGPVSASTGVTM